MIDQFEISSLLNLLARIREHGIKLSVSDDKLSVKVAKGKNIDDKILSEVTANKSKLIEHLKETSGNELDHESNRFFFKGETYYAITAVQNYWLNDDIDSEFKQKEIMHGSVFLMHDIEGNLNVDQLKMAVLYLVRRHESFRTTFHKLEGKFWMKIHSVNEFSNFLYANGTGMSDDEIEKFARFHGHKFEFESAPLFFVRLIQIQKEKFIISMKLHHVICDSWSIRILIRDLVVAYRAYSSNVHPELPELKFQLKDCLSLINFYTFKYLKKHRTYWTNRHRTLPPELIIPLPRIIGNKTDNRGVLTEIFRIPDDLSDKMKLMVRDLSVSMFVVFVGTVKYFLFQKTGQCDIALSSYLFGRDHPRMQDQIGCYAKTVLYRTIFENNDSMRDAIQKVGKSIDDSRTYYAFSLIDRLKNLVQEGQNVTKSFSKINVQFIDETSFEWQNGNSAAKEDKSLETKSSSWKNLPNQHIANELELLFFGGIEEMKLHVVFDGSIYDPRSIRKLINEYFAFVHENISRI